MPLVEINCPECNADLKVDPKKDKAVCDVCLTKFIIEAAIRKHRAEKNKNKKNKI